MKQLKNEGWWCPPQPHLTLKVPFGGTKLIKVFELYEHFILKEKLYLIKTYISGHQIPRCSRWVRHPGFETFKGIFASKFKKKIWESNQSLLVQWTSWCNLKSGFWGPLRPNFQTKAFLEEEDMRGVRSPILNRVSMSRMNNRWSPTVW